MCTNDVWGNTVPLATNNAYVRLSLFQDYNTSNQAVFLNDQLLVQDLRFAGSPGAYSRLLIQNIDSNCWLDNVWVKTNFDTATQTNNFNGDGLADALEVNDYGYARRTLYVSSAATNLVPYYSSITNAVAAWRPRDIIHVFSGDYSGETVSLAANPSNVVFEGVAFAVSNLVVASNASASFAQSVSCGTLSVTGQVAMATGASLTSSTAHVLGVLSFAGSDSFVVTNIDFAGSGSIYFTNAQFVAIAAGVARSGTYTVSTSTWGSLNSVPLPFSDNFDGYADNTPMTNFIPLFNGWNASSGSVTVQTAVANSGKAVVMPEGTLLSNSINSATTKIWTDYYIRPTLGAEPWAPATNTSSFLAYANTNGYLVVATAGGGWHVCSNQLDSYNSPPILLRSNAFTRITVCQDLSVSPPQFAVFVASNLVAQGLSCPAVPSLVRYSSFVVNNVDSSAYLDDVLITTNMPSSLTNGVASDLDRDGIPDAVEIALRGTITNDPPWLGAPTVSAVDTNGATLVVSVTNNGNSVVLSSGAVWGTTVGTVANPSNSLVLTGMCPGQHYYARGWASNAIGLAYSTACEFFTEPVQASNLTNQNVAAGTFTITWAADASSTGTVVLVKQGTVDAAPADGSNYTATASFGSGVSLETGNYVVYSGTGTSVTVNNLVYGLPYQAAAFAYAGSGSLIQYRTNNVPTCTLNWQPRGSVYTIR